MWLLFQLSETPTASAVTFSLNGSTVAVDDKGASLLDALREQLGCRSVKDGCSPQGQCGCCTVWVDGAPRVACVTAVRRVAGRSVTTVEGLDPELRTRWVAAFVGTGASQCGFCTPGILLRLAALEKGDRGRSRQAVESALLAHLCRCTGWQSIVEAACIALDIPPAEPTAPHTPLARDQDPATERLLAAWRAQIEGRVPQGVGPDIVLGGGGFADDRAPAGALVQLGTAETQPALGLAAARAAATKVQGRNTTLPPTHPVDLPPGEWSCTLQTTWVEPAYLEPDASWCAPGDAPASPLANGGAFGGKRLSPVAARAAALVQELGRPVRVLWSREDVVRYGAKRPPLAVGLRADGTGVVRIGRTAGSPDLGRLRDRISEIAPGVAVEEVEIAGPPVSDELRGAGWVEVLATLGALSTSCTPTAEGSQAGQGKAEVRLPGAGRALVTVDTRGGVLGRGTVTAEVWAGEPLHGATLRSYVLGAVHQALGLVWSEGVAVDEDGVPIDLTIRSLGILAAREMPEVDVIVHDDDRWPLNGSDAVFAATVAAAHIADGALPQWPTRRRSAGGGARAVPASSDREEFV